MATRVVSWRRSIAKNDTEYLRIRLKDHSFTCILSHVDRSGSSPNDSLDKNPTMWFPQPQGSRLRGPASPKRGLSRFRPAAGVAVRCTAMTSTTPRRRVPPSSISIARCWPAPPARCSRGRCAKPAWSAARIPGESAALQAVQHGRRDAAVDGAGPPGASRWPRAAQRSVVQQAADGAADALAAMVQPLAAPLFDEHRAAGRPIVLATTTPVRPGQAARRPARPRRRGRHPLRRQRRRHLRRHARRAVRVERRQARRGPRLGATRTASTWPRASPTATASTTRRCCPRSGTRSSSTPTRGWC